MACERLANWLSATNWSSSVKSSSSKDEMFTNIESAKKEWEDAKNIFENVSQPDLVDYAIYKVEAAEQKYVYLLKQYKSNNFYGDESGTFASPFLHSSIFILSSTLIPDLMN